jgi:CHAT domain-containing protein/tetratricopeptide (TPR) repeat protein
MGSSGKKAATDILAKSIRRRCLAALTLLLSAVEPSGASQALEGAPRARLVVETAAGEFRSVEAWKTGGAWTLSVRDASGAEVASVSWRDPPVITLSWVAARDGAYTVECEGEAGSRAECEVGALITPLSARSSRAVVESSLRHGYSLLRSWSLATTKDAEREFSNSLEKSQALGLADLEIDALLGLAAAREATGATESSIKLLETAVTRAEAAGEKRRFVLATARLATSLANLGQQDRVQVLIEKAASTASEQGFSLGVASAQLGRGDIGYARSELAAAEREYRAAFRGFSQLGNEEGQIDAHLGMGYALADLSQDPEAKMHFEAARDLARATGDTRREATALRLLGNVFAKMTEEVAAIQSFEAAQALFEKADDQMALVGLYNGLGELHGRLNDLAIAVQYHQKAVTVASSTGQRLGEGIAWMAMGGFQRRLGRYADAAASYERARALLGAAGDPAMEAYALAGLGNVAAAQGRFEEALERLQAALKVVRAGGEARLSSGILNDIADAQLSLGRVGPSRESASVALRLAREAKDSLREARSLFLLARASRREGALDDARELTERSLAVGEEVRARVPGHELRALFFEELESRYAFHVDLLMELDRARPGARFDTLALAASERGRARALLDRFAQGGAPASAGDAERLERERTLRDQVRMQAFREDLEPHEAGAASGAPLEERLAELRRVLAVDSFENAVSRPFDAARMDEIRSRLAVPGTLLVEIGLGPERSYLWAIGKDRLVVHELPAREVLESQARELYSLLTARQRDLAGSAREKRARAESQDALFYEKGLALSRALLGPIEDLDAYERLVVVSDGLLNYVPLAALPHPRTADPAGGYRPLVLTHEVVCVPSLAAMVAIGERSSKRAEQSPSAGERRRSRIAVLADPVFTADDPRVGAAAPAAARPARVQPPSADTNLRGTRQGVGNLPRLLASREEAASIAKAAAGADVTLTTGFGVDRAKTVAALEDGYQVVHLATHGILNDEHPLLSGIVTSLVDERGVRQDGFLRAQDVYDTRVGAEVVVLSACETALGRLLRGEGITGLVHAFLHAGADSIVASRWRVEDAATQQLMAEFYRSLLVDGASVSAALRKAQIQLLKSRPTSAPFFWAAFEVQGLSPRLTTPQQ